jgi:hypothetical protein
LPYNRQQATIGDVLTPIFEPHSDLNHLTKVQCLVMAWVEFVKESPDDEMVFRNFPVEDSRTE